MFVRSALVAAAATLSVAAFAPALAYTATSETSAQCEEMNFRVYFDQNATGLNGLAMRTLHTAERQVAECPYAELHVRMDPSTPFARERGAAIVAAADERVWNVTRVESREGVQRASYSNGPDYAEVVMTPNAMPAAAPLAPRGGAGV